MSKGRIMRNIDTNSIYSKLKPKIENSEYVSNSSVKKIQRTQCHKMLFMPKEMASGNKHEKENHCKAPNQYMTPIIFDKDSNPSSSKISSSSKMHCIDRQISIKKDDRSKIINAAHRRGKSQEDIISNKPTLK